MSDTVLIVLIIAVVIVLWIYRYQLRSFILRALGIEMEMNTHEKSTDAQKEGVSVKRNWLFGKNTINVDGQDAQVDENLAAGENEIKVKQQRQDKRLE